MKTKKLLGTALALAMILPSFGIANAAELFKNLKLDGQIDVQATSARNTSDFSTRFSPPTGVQPPATAAAGVTSKNDHIGNVQTRLMLGLDWDILDDVHAKVSITKNDRTWGTGGGSNQTPGNSQSLVGAPGAATGVAGNTVVDQAYFKVDKVFGAVDTTIGRQYYGDSGDLIIYYGPSDKPEYGLPTNAIDAFKFNWSNDQFGVEGLAGETPGGGATVATKPSANTDLTGLILSWKGNDNASGSLYTWNQQTHAAGALGADPNGPGGFGGGQGKNDNLYITGARVKLSGGGAWFKGEFDKNWGDNRVAGVGNLPAADNGLSNSMRYKGWAVKANLGYKADVSGVGAFTGWGDFGYGTGQHDAHSNEGRGFVAIAGDYRPGAIYGRFAPYTNGGAQPLGLGAGAVGANLATNTLNNRIITGLGIKVNPDAAKKLTLGVSVWDFHTQTVATPITPSITGGAAGLNNSSTLVGQQAFSGNKHIGYETDFEASWKHSDNVSFGVEAGRFMPGGIIYIANQSQRPGDTSAKSGTGTNPALLAAFDVRVKF